MTACPRTHAPPGRYLVAGERRCAWHTAFSGRLLRTSLPLAGVVGSVLTLINQGTVLAAGDLPGELAWKVPLTYSVPFLVSTWSQLRALRITATAS